MMKHLSRSSLMALLAMTVVLGVSEAEAQQGYRYTAVTTEANSGVELTSEVAIWGRHLRVQASQGGSQTVDMRFNGDDQVMIASDYASRTYVEFDRETIEALGAQMQAAQGALGNMSAMLQEAMKDMSEEDKERMREMGIPGMEAGAGGAEAPRVSTRVGNDGSDSTPFGACEWVRYEFDDGTVDKRYCVTRDRFAGFEQSRDAFESMAQFFESLMDALGDMAQMGPMAQMDQNPFDNIDELDNLPAIVETYQDGNLVATTRITEFVEADLGAGDFAPLDGFRKQEMGLPGR